MIFFCQKTSLHNQVNMIARFSAQSIDRKINVHWKAKHVDCSPQHHKLHTLDICLSVNNMSELTADLGGNDSMKKMYVTHSFSHHFFF